jgi:hypothetical protein
MDHDVTDPGPQASLDDLAIPGCAPWRARNDDAELCPSVHCGRCQTIRQISGVPVLEPYIGGLDG